MADETPRPVIVPPGEGLPYGNVEFLARSEDTPRFNASIVTVAPGREGPPEHAHESEDDAFYVLSGELTMRLGPETVTAPEGTFVLVPPGLVHTFANRSEQPARILNIHAPAGFDRRLMED
jgi:mannose-6-phosphate isomerase-like protein (cupin superfamily)